MRKILLATTALVGFAVAGAAQAATTTSPLNVTVGGSVDVLAGAFHQSKAAAGDHQSNDSFETLYDINFGIAGKSSNGIEYGGNLSLNNSPDISNFFGGTTNGNTVQITTADLFLAGAFGKVVLGDSHGATDLNVVTPTVGEGQVNGNYVTFLNTSTFAKTFVYGVDGTDHSTNITYFTPKVGNDNNKVQAGVTFIPHFYNYGSNTVGSNTQSTTSSAGASLSPYSNVVKGAVAYTGNFKPVSLGVSANVITGSSKQTGPDAGWLKNALAGEVQDFTSFGVGASAALQGFTFGANYTDLGRYNTTAGQTKKQQIYGAGLKYEFSKVGVGVSYLGGEAYDNMLNLVGTSGGVGTGANANYVKDFNSYGIGGSYTWAPGLTTNADAVLFDQKTQSSTKNDGYVLLVSQKLAF